MSKSTRDTCFCMGMGVFFYEVILGLIAVPVSKAAGYSLLSLELGILVGTVAVLGMVIDMGISTEDGLYGGNEAYARRKIVVHSLLRKAALIVIIAMFWNNRYVNVLAVVLSVFGLKSGAYMYPLFKKIFEKRGKEDI